MSTARASAKVNLGLKVEAPRSDGYHPLHSLTQTIDWLDEVTVADAEADEVVVSNDMAPADEGNLAWAAADSVRTVAGSSERLGTTRRARRNRLAAHGRSRLSQVS